MDRDVLMVATPPPRVRRWQETPLREVYDTVLLLLREQGTVSFEDVRKRLKLGPGVISNKFCFETDPFRLVYFAAKNRKGYPVELDSPPVSRARLQEIVVEVGAQMRPKDMSGYYAPGGGFDRGHPRRR